MLKTAASQLRWGRAVLLDLVACILVTRKGIVSVECWWQSLKGIGSIHNKESTKCLCTKRFLVACLLCAGTLQAWSYLWTLSNLHFNSQAQGLSYPVLLVGRDLTKTHSSTLTTAISPGQHCPPLALQYMRNTLRVFFFHISRKTVKYYNVACNKHQLFVGIF